MPKVFTMVEAATELRISRRKLQEWLSFHPADSLGTPFYFTTGVKKLFTERDIERIIAACREQEEKKLAAARPRARYRENWKPRAAPSQSARDVLRMIEEKKLAERARRKQERDAERQRKRVAFAAGVQAARKAQSEDHS